MIVVVRAELLAKVPAAGDLRRVEDRPEHIRSHLGQETVGTPRDAPIQLVDVPGLVAGVLELAPAATEDARAPGRRETAFLNTAPLAFDTPS